MKKILLSLVAVFFTCNCAFAGLDIKVTQGDKKFFKTNAGNAVLDFKFDNTKYDNKMPLAEKFDDVAKVKKIALNGFTETFNDKSKGIKVVENNADAQYKFTFEVTNMDQYFKVMGFIPGFATKAWGTFTVTDIKSGEALVVVDVDEVDGGASPSPDETISDCFEEIAKQLNKLK